MSNINQNNNRKNHNNFNNRNKSESKNNYNVIKAPLFLSADLNENIVNEILDVLAETKFNKISIPINTYRSLIDSSIDKSDGRVYTIGYINNYDSENNEFTVVIFNKFVNLVKEFGNIAIDLKFTYKENLGTITKFNIVPVFDAE